MVNSCLAIDGIVCIIENIYYWGSELYKMFIFLVESYLYQSQTCRYNDRIAQNALRTK
jgi:hypothetical protein